MAQRNQPKITHTEILTLAATHLRDGIVRLQADAQKMERCAAQAENSTDAAAYLNANQEQRRRLMDQLITIQAMYLFETGTQLGLSNEIPSNLPTDAK